MIYFVQSQYLQHQSVSTVQFQHHLKQKCFSDLCIPFYIRKQAAGLSRFESFFQINHRFQSNLKRIVIFWVESLLLKSNLQMCSNRDLNPKCDWDCPSQHWTCCGLTIILHVFCYTSVDRNTEHHTRK